MEKSFLLERWERNETGFHQKVTNAYLQRYWACVASPPEPVFVPLCGKSLDLLWLRDHGHPVLGVELSDIAIHGFFSEHQLTPKQIHLPKFESFSAGQIEILWGNFFDLDKKQFEHVSAVYDRAALVALPSDLRQSYVTHMRNILPAGIRLLLVTFDYSAHEIKGPPFPVSPDEVHRLFNSWATISHLETHDASANNPRYRERGATRVEEHVFLITYGNR